MEDRLKYKYSKIVDMCVTLGNDASKLRGYVDDLAKNGMFFGATAYNIIDLLAEYELRGGTMPMTSESIKKAFSRSNDIELKEPDSLKATCNEIAMLSFNLHTRLCAIEKHPTGGKRGGQEGEGNANT